MTLPPFRFGPLALGLFAASGCAATTSDPRYPSLLPRPIESRSDAEPVVAPVSVAPDPATDAKIAGLRKALDDNAAGFAVADAAAERAAVAAKGDAVGGERWIAAQAALAQLDALHATTSASLTEIDDTALARASDGLPPYPALDALRDAAQAMDTMQSARIAALQARLPAA